MFDELRGNRRMEDGLPLVDAAHRFDDLAPRHALQQVAGGALLKVRTALPAVEKALKDKDVAAANQPVAAIGEASHDLTHEFYDKWLPTHKGAQFSPMAMHVGYLDLSANIADLRSRVAEWEKGDEQSLNIAKEKAERIEALIRNMPWSGNLAEPVKKIEEAMPAAMSALKAKDIAAVKQPIGVIGEASHDLTHVVYDKSMAGMKAVDDPACIQAAYLDLSANVADLRSRVAAWEKGDEQSLSIAKEKAERIGVLLAHTAWPDLMVGPTGQIQQAVEPVEKAFKARDVAAAKQALAAIGEAPHDLTHAFYDKWLMGPVMAVAAR